jgi:hypothetical protein
LPTTFGEAFAKAQLAAGQKLPTQGAVFISVTDHDKPHVAEVARKFVDMGFKLVATAWHRRRLEAAGMNVERVYKVKEGGPNVVDFIKGERIQLIVNTPHGGEPWFDEKAIRRAAVTARIPTITTLAAARAAAEGIAALQRGEVNVKALQHLLHDRVTPVPEPLASDESFRRCFRIELLMLLSRHFSSHHDAVLSRRQRLFQEARIQCRALFEDSCGRHCCAGLDGRSHHAVRSGAARCAQSPRAKPLRPNKV